MATEPTKSEGLRPARRTIVKGAAWAVPAVAVASAAPAMAQSPVDPIDPYFVPGTFCKHSSNNQAHGVVCFTNTTGEDIVLTLQMFEWNAEERQAYFSIGGALSTTATIPANQERCLFVDAGPYPTNTNTTATIYFTYPGAVGTPSVSTQGSTDMSNCNSVPGQPGNPAPHPTPGPNSTVAEYYETESTVDEATAVEEPAVEAPAAEEPAVEAPAVEEPAVEAPAVEAPAVEAPAVEEPAVEAPAVEEPVVEAPAVEEQGTVDTAEVTAAPPSTDEATEDN